MSLILWVGGRESWLGSFGAPNIHCQLFSGADCTLNPSTFREAPRALLHTDDGDGSLLLLLLRQGPGSSARLAPP